MARKTNKQTNKKTLSTGGLFFCPSNWKYQPQIDSKKEDQFYFVEIYLNRSFNSRYNCPEDLSKKKQKTKNTHTFPFEAITERYSTDKKEEGKLFILSILISWHGLRSDKASRWIQALYIISGKNGRNLNKDLLGNSELWENLKFPTLLTVPLRDPHEQHVIFSRICALSIALSSNDVTNFWSLVWLRH